MYLASGPLPSLISPFVPAGAVLLLLMAAGLLLWALGGRLLRPGLAIIGLIAGVPIGIWLGGAVAPEVPPVFFAAAGALAGLVAAALSYAIALSAVTAVLTGILALMAAWSAADMGLIDASSAAARIDAATGEIERAAPAPGGFETLTRILLGSGAPELAATQGARGTRDPRAAAASSTAQTPAATPSSASGDASESIGMLERIRAAVEAQWSTMPQPLRTLLLASLAAGVVAGFLFGLLCSGAAARVVTSLAGSIILLVAGIPLLSALLGRTDDLLPPRPAAWFVAIALLTIIGYGVQRAIAPPRPQATPQS